MNTRHARYQTLASRQSNTTLAFSAFRMGWLVMMHAPYFIPLAKTKADQDMQGMLCPAVCESRNRKLYSEIDSETISEIDSRSPQTRSPLQQPATHKLQRAAVRVSVARKLIISDRSRSRFIPSPTGLPDSDIRAERRRGAEPDEFWLQRFESDSESRLAPPADSSKRSESAFAGKSTLQACPRHVRVRPPVLRLLSTEQGE